MRISTKFLAGASLVAASLVVASPASATSTVAVDSPCDSLTDGDAQGCKFTGNINTNNSGNESYLKAQAAYNAWSPGGGANDITLTPLADFSGSGTQSGIHFTLNGNLNSGSWTLDPGVTLTYFAVKAGNGFIMYQYTGANSFTTAGLGKLNKQGVEELKDLSHIIFFGSVNAVPEPATWGMMLIGVGMIGSSMRRRRKNRVAIRQFA
jgi:hypothetical protein